MSDPRSEPSWLKTAVYAEQVTTEAQRDSLAAKIARDDWQMLSLGRLLTTQELDAALQFMQRLTLCSTATEKTSSEPRST